MDTGKRLKEARENIGYTLRRAAKKSHINPDTLWDYEHAKDITFAEVARLADIYRVDVSRLLSDEPLPKERMLWCKERR